MQICAGVRLVVGAQQARFGRVQQIDTDIECAKAIALCRGHPEVGVAHGQRTEYSLREESPEGFSAGDFHDSTQNIGRHRVFPLSTWVERKRQRCSHGRMQRVEMGISHI